MDTLMFMSDTSQGNTSEGENIGSAKLTKRQFDNKVDQFGAIEGRGDNARPALFVLTCDASKAGVVEEKDAEDIFARYSMKVAEAQKIGWKPQASAKQQTSKLRVAIKLGKLVHVDGTELCNRIQKAQERQRAANEGKNDFSPFDGLVKVGRAQLRTPDAALDDDVIDGLLIKAAGDSPEEADRLEKIMKACTSLADAKEDPVTPETVDVLQEVASTIMTRIKELGGSTSMRKQAEKVEAEASKARASLAALVDRAATARAALAA